MSKNRSLERLPFTNFSENIFFLFWLRKRLRSRGILRPLFRKLASKIWMSLSNESLVWTLIPFVSLIHAWLWFLIVKKGYFKNLSSVNELNFYRAQRELERASKELNYYSVLYFLENTGSDYMVWYKGCPKLRSMKKIW